MPSIALSLVPVTRDARTVLAIHEVASALESIVGGAIEPHLFDSPEALAADYREGRPTLVWASPVAALTTLRRAVPLACTVREGVAYYHSVLLVRRESALRTTLDLRGTTAAWVAATSASGYLFPRIALAGTGLDPTSLFRAEQFLGSHGAVVEAVASGQADVGATFAVFERGDASAPLRRAGHHDTQSQDTLRVLFSTPAIPSDLFVASPQLAEAHGSLLVRALTELHTRAPEALTLAFGADALVPTSERELATLRQQLADAEALGLFARPPGTMAPPAP